MKVGIQCLFLSPKAIANLTFQAFPLKHTLNMHFESSLCLSESWSTSLAESGGSGWGVRMDAEWSRLRGRDVATEPSTHSWIGWHAPWGAEESLPLVSPLYLQITILGISCIISKHEHLEVLKWNQAAGLEELRHPRRLPGYWLVAQRQREAGESEFQLTLLLERQCLTHCVFWFLFVLLKLGRNSIMLLEFYSFGCSHRQKSTQGEDRERTVPWAVRCLRRVL